MAAGCTVIGPDHPESAAGAVIDDAGFVTDPTTEAPADALDRALAGEPPPTDPPNRASQYDWGAVTTQAEVVSGRAMGGT